MDDGNGVECDNKVDCDDDKVCKLFCCIDLQKSVLHLMWQPKQCNGPFNKSCCSFKTARCLSLSLLLIMMALLAALVSFSASLQ